MRRFRLLLLVAVWCLLQSGARAEGEFSTDDVEISADHVDYLQEGVVSCTGNVVIAYKYLTLYSEELTYDRNTHIVVAPKWTRLVYKNFEVMGERVIYSIDTRAGQFENAHAVADLGPFEWEGRWYERKWYAYGKKVTKDPNVEQFHIEDGRMTTCPPEYQSPLYHIQAKQLSFYPADKGDPTSQGRIVARNCFLKLEGIPIFWLPQVTYTIREDDNRSPLQVSTGYDSKKGAFVRTSIDVFRNQYLTLTPHFDFYSKHGFAFGFDGDYNYQYTNITWFSGTWQTFFLEDISRQFLLQSPSSGEKDGDHMWRYRFKWQHSQGFGPGAGWLQNGLLLWDVNWLSDADLMQEFYRDELETWGKEDTWLDFTKPIGPDNEVSIYAVVRINDFQTTYERLPELRHVFRKREVLTIPALGVPVYYESQSRAGFYRYLESDELDNNGRYSLWRAYTDHKLSAPKRFFNFLNFDPFVGLAGEAGYISGDGEEGGWSRNRKGKLVWTPPRHYDVFWMFDYERYTRIPVNVYTKHLRAGQSSGFLNIIPYGGADMNFKMNRTYDLEGTFAGEMMQKYLSSDNQKLRHIIEPKVRVLGVADLGTESGTSAGVDYGIRNAFQTKRKGRNVDLLDLTIMAGMRAYDDSAFEPRLKGRKDAYGFHRQDKTANRIGFDLNASPLEWLNVDADGIWDLEQNELMTFNVGSHYDMSWAVQRAFASPYMLRSLRGRKDEWTVDLGYRHLHDVSDLIRVGTRVWFDDFTPLLSYELQQKNWARELTRGWGYEYAMRFESQSLTLQEMEHTIYKNWKKCIDTAIMYRLRDDDHTIMATFWLTAYPGSKIDMGM
ncbi:LPS-assembly protein LptD [bacterium]|nr:LPS-assembly protein LptD [bacterium]